MELFLDGKVQLFSGDCREQLKLLPDNSVDAGVMDPPYALVSIGKRFGADDAAPAKVGATGAYARASAGFMGKKWDTGETAFAMKFWAEVLRVLKPGAHLAAFSGTRTYHRMACAIEDAGFEIRDQLAWTYGSGFPKSHDVSKAIDKAAGAERKVVGTVRAGIARSARKGGEIVGAKSFEGLKQSPVTDPATDLARHWQGWGTALKPAWEPICLARKPLSEKTVAANVLRWGTGAINVDGCRVDAEKETGWGGGAGLGYHGGADPDGGEARPVQGRFPANLIHDGSDEVLAAFPHTHSAGAAGYTKTRESYDASNMHVTGGSLFRIGDDGGSAARFFYTAKADGDDRLGSKHPTVKPVDLMQWLCRLITPPGGVVLDCFAGTGTTGEAAWREGFTAILMEREAEYQGDIRKRMGIANQHSAARKIARAKIITEKDPDDFFNI